MRDEIIKMAREAGFSEAWLSAGDNPPHFEAPAVIVKRFFHMAQAAEREACAQIAFNAKTYIEAAKAIRARGQA